MDIDVDKFSKSTLRKRAKKARTRWDKLNWTPVDAKDIEEFEGEGFNFGDEYMGMKEVQLSEEELKKLGISVYNKNLQGKKENQKKKKRKLGETFEEDEEDQEGEYNDEEDEVVIPVYNKNLREKKENQKKKKRKPGVIFKVDEEDEVEKDELEDDEDGGNEEFFEDEEENEEGEYDEEEEEGEYDEEEEEEEYDEENEEEGYDEEVEDEEKEIIEEEQRIANNVDLDMSAWSSFDLHPLLVQGLATLGFQYPTPVQTLCLPAAIFNRRDIVGSAETGSGKTLAFGLPILHSLLSDKNKKKNKNSPKKLAALILAPTRELAIQVHDHLKKVAQFTDIKIISIVGGISVVKQQRLISYEPDIVVATPGRFWEIASESKRSYVSDLSGLRFLVIDEADRMIEQGHFKEVDEILKMIRTAKNQKKGFTVTDAELIEESEKKGKKEDELKLQKFIFSATMTVGESFKTKLLGKKAGRTPKTDSVTQLFEKIGFAPPGPKIVDVSRKEIIAENIQEARIFTTVEDKDIYLYYFILRHPGRTIVFVNSIDGLRRMLSVLVMLNVPSVGLHAQMQQRQRLKNLDRFKKSKDLVMIATDVASRGLDIENVEHVIHYQLPRAVDIYVHRSGRTARGSNSGLSVMFVSPEEDATYKKICATMNKDGIAEFPIERQFLPDIIRRVKLAREIDKAQHLVSKVQSKNSWFKKAAEEMDIELDEDLLDEDEETRKKMSKATQELKTKKLQLQALLHKEIIPKGFLPSFPTADRKSVV